jgi:hypothetical protein
MIGQASPNDEYWFGPGGTADAVQRAWAQIDLTW